MGQRIRSDRSPYNESVDRVSDAIKRIKHCRELALEVFEATVGCVNDPRLAMLPSKEKGLVHPRTMPPNLLQLARGDTKIGEEGGFISKFGRSVDASRMNGSK